MHTIKYVILTELIEERFTRLQILQIKKCFHNSLLKSSCNIEKKKLPNSSVCIIFFSVSCTAGTELQPDGSCKACERGYYRTQANDNCLACEDVHPGMTTPGEGSASSTDCTLST